MKHVFPLIYILMISTACESVELIPAASSDLMTQVRSHKGEKAVLLNVWALWCVPCVEEFPMIVDLDKEMSELEVIFISADFDDQLEEGRFRSPGFQGHGSKEATSPGLNGAVGT